MTWTAVAVGGALGSMGRHAVNHAVARIMGQPSALSTALANIVVEPEDSNPEPLSPEP
jgi:fluoride ion exporter CrcB/FEX